MFLSYFHFIVIIGCYTYKENRFCADPLLEEQLIPNLDLVSGETVSFPSETGVDNEQSCH